MFKEEAGNSENEACVEVSERYEKQATLLKANVESKRKVSLQKVITGKQEQNLVITGNKNFHLPRKCSHH